MIRVRDPYVALAYVMTALSKTLARARSERYQEAPRAVTGARESLTGSVDVANPTYDLAVHPKRVVLSDAVSEVEDLLRGSADVLEEADRKLSAALADWQNDEVEP